MLLFIGLKESCFLGQNVTGISSFIARYISVSINVFVAW